MQTRNFCLCIALAVFVQAPAFGADGQSQSTFKPTLAQLREILGQPRDAEPLHRFLQLLPSSPEKFEMKYGSWLISRPTGITISFRLSTGTVAAIILYPGSVDGYKTYQGELPGAITWADRRIDVEKKLGPPPLSQGTGTSRYRAEYPALGLMVEYATPNQKDPQNRISALMIVTTRVFPPANAPKPAFPRLTFRLVAQAPVKEVEVEMLTDLSLPAGAPKVPVLRQIVLDETGIASVSPDFVENDRPAISLEMTDAASAKLLEVSSANIGRAIAIVLDGQLLTAPIIRDPMSKHVVISPSKKENLDDDLAGRMHAAVNALPAQNEHKN